MTAFCVDLQKQFGLQYGEGLLGPRCADSHAAGEEVMKWLTLCRSDLRTTPGVIFCAVVFTCATATGAFAQYAGGHFGGAGHVTAPPASHAGVSRSVNPVRPPLVNPAPRSFLVRPPNNRIILPPRFVVGYPYPRRPFFPRRPIFPIGVFPPAGFGLFGIPFFGLGFGWGLGPGFYGGCDPFWVWGYGCNALPFYEYEPAYTAPAPGLSYSQPQMEIQNWPVYFDGEENSQFVQLYLKDGTVYSVTDYWLVNGDLHFKTIEDHGEKVAEHTIDFSQLDLQRTIDVNTARGFRFVLRNQPLEQYLRDHPPSDSPDEAPATQGPAE
jgi:hypothetical protein